ncbi:MAG: hypothetical protein KDA83_15200 [Planctomycetales bacterium]|nr:hypothetical protein [Planctomycetales bacterium]
MNQEVNPYESLLESTTPNQPPAILKMSSTLQKTLSNFRAQTLALGVLWIIIGGLAIIGGTLIMVVALNDNSSVVNNDQDSSTNGFLFYYGLFSGIMGLVWIVVGLKTISKSVTAIYIGLTLSTLSMIGNVLTFSLCPALILVAAVFQSIHVLRFSRILTQNGIPLTAKPSNDGW